MPNYRSAQKGCSARLESSVPREQQMERERWSLSPACPAKRSRAPGLPRQAGIPGPGRTQRSVPSTAPCAGRYVTAWPGRGDTGTVPKPGSLARYLRDKRRLHLLPLVPIPIPDRPRTRRPEGRTASLEGLTPAPSGEPGRRPQPRQPAGSRSILHRSGAEACSQASRTGSPGPAPASAALSLAEDRAELSPRPPGPHRPPHPRRGRRLPGA